MDNGIFLLVLLVLIAMLGASLILLIVAWGKLSVTLQLNSTPMILIYTALIISYFVISLMTIQLIVGFILYMIGYGKTDPSLTKYLMDRYGYTESKASELVTKMGDEGINYFKSPMMGDIDAANRLVLRFHGAGEVFKSVSVILYLFSLVLIFVLGTAALATINQQLLTNNSGFGMLISSVVISGISIITLGVIYYFMLRKSSERRKKLQVDENHIKDLMSVDRKKL